MKLKTTIILLSLFICSNTGWADSDTTNLKDLIHINLRAGYIGTTWSPKGTEPITVSTYGRSMTFAELELAHPFRVFGEELDFVEIPQLRIETNSGYKSEGGGFPDVIPITLSGNPYLLTSIKVVFFDFLSYQISNEKFDVNYSDPAGWDQEEGSDISEYNRVLTNSKKDLEVGVIGSLDENIHNTMLEIGYFRSNMKYPILNIYDTETTRNYQLDHKRLITDGLYVIAHTKPVPLIWPMHSQVKLKVGDKFSVEFLFRHETNAFKRIRLGLALSGSWSWISRYEDEFGDDIDVKSNQPSDRRFKLSIYSVMELF
jgi:hypothetical protein